MSALLPKATLDAYFQMSAKRQRRAKNIRQKIKPDTRKNQALLQDCRQSSGYSKRTLLAGPLARVSRKYQNQE
jgi:hypothetical protein